ncbi:hypothetical protein BJY52DRAFT_1381376 [Lactarius psammicola]|nr:hypothetical protein BJY52DRAFT_1381376 [Lactarius psammicola]
MVRQTYDHMVRDDAARHRANQRSLDRLFVEAQEQLGPFINKWKMGYIKLFAFNRAKELRESIARTVTDPILDGDEITWARERIRVDHAEEIEAARRDTRAQISSKKKAWAVAYRDLVKLDWLTKAAEELGYVLISKDDAEEREGRMAKHHAGPVGKRERSSSRASIATPSEVPATPENRGRLLDTSWTPTARKKTKGKHVLAQPRPLRSRSNSFSSQPSDLSDTPDVDMVDIKRPLFFASSYPAVSGISIPVNVRPSQALDADLCDPRARLSEPATNISVFVAPAPNVPDQPLLPRHKSLHRTPREGLRRQCTTRRTRWPTISRLLKVPETIAVPPTAPLPTIYSPPTGANLMTSFTAQINSLSSRIDAQDEVIKIHKQPVGKGKGKVDKPLKLGQLLFTTELSPNRLALPETLTIDFEGGVALKGKLANPVSVENTKITIARGQGLKDKSAEDRLYKSNPGGIVQVARSAMERMSAQAPPVLYGVVCECKLT